MRGWKTGRRTRGGGLGWRTDGRMVYIFSLSSSQCSLLPCYFIEGVGRKGMSARYQHFCGTQLPLPVQSPAGVLKMTLFSFACVCMRAYVHACVLLTHFRCRLILTSDLHRGRAKPYVCPTEVTGEQLHVLLHYPGT